MSPRLLLNPDVPAETTNTGIPLYPGIFVNLTLGVQGNQQFGVKLRVSEEV